MLEERIPMTQFKTLFILAATLVGLAAATAARADVQNVTITIDNATVQPISTGIVPSAAGELIIITEGSVNAVPVNTSLTQGHMGPGGETRLQRVGQPVGDGMPYGCLLGSFNSTSLPNFQFVGDRGSVHVSASDIGDEFHIGLNMSDTDLASMSGSIVVTLIYVSTGSADMVELDLDSSAPHVVSTGLFAEAGDQHVALAMGRSRISFLTSGVTGGWFGPAGELKFNRVGQPRSEGPFGGLYGTYTAPEFGFYIGDAGAWKTQPADIGQELTVYLNMSETDWASIEGSLKVWVVRIPNPTSAVGDAGNTDRLSAQGYPNPSAGAMHIRFALPTDDDVLLRVYDASGRMMVTLADDSRAAGTHEVRWNGLDAAGEAVASGTYFYQLSTSEGSRTGRIVLAR